MITQVECDAILSNSAKRIEGDLKWADDRNHKHAKKFRVPVLCEGVYLLEIIGRWNSRSERLSYVMLYNGIRRIYALDLGAEHRNPDRNLVASPHKHRWTDAYMDKYAYQPEDITASWDQPVEVWRQFCAEAKIIHTGILHPPS